MRIHLLIDRPALLLVDRSALLFVDKSTLPLRHSGALGLRDSDTLLLGDGSALLLGNHLANLLLHCRTLGFEGSGTLLRKNTDDTNCCHQVKKNLLVDGVAVLSGHGTTLGLVDGCALLLGCPGALDGVHHVALLLRHDVALLGGQGLRHQRRDLRLQGGNHRGTHRGRVGTG